MLVTFLILYFCIKVEQGDDIYLLKATNLIIVFAYTLIKHFDVKSELIIDFYYLMPIFLIQGLYELYDRKTKFKSACKSNTYESNTQDDIKKIIQQEDTPST